MHFISNIKIKNFRSIENEFFLLSKYTPLVGYNNAGKSNIIQAVKWFVKPFSLQSADFYDKTKPIEVIGHIEGIDEDILSKLTATNRVKIKKFLYFDKIKFKRVQISPNCKASDIKLEVLDPGFDYIPDVWRAAPTGLPVALKELFPEVVEVGAMENAPDDTSKYKKNNTIGKLIAEIIKPIEENHTENIAKELKKISNKFDIDGSRRLQELKKFDKESTKTLNEFFPGIELKIHIPTPNIRELLQNSILKIVEGSINRDLSEYGHGTQRSIQMALIKYLSEVQNKKKFTTTLLLIDEPELFLHPQAIEQVRSALKGLSSYGYQVIFSTHSPQMIHSDDITKTLLIRKKDNKTYTRKRMNEALNSTLNSKHKAQFELVMTLTNLSQILFSEKVVLVEGTTEIRLLPTLFYKKTKKTLGQSKIALVEQNSSSSTKKMMEVLKAMDLPVKAIVDLDFAFRGAVKKGYLLESDILPCKIFLAANKPIEMKLEGDGFPGKNKRSNKWNTAAQGFEWLAKQPAMKVEIQRLHNILKSKNIWLWTKGAIEKHLNLNEKDENVWMQFLENFATKSFGRYIRDPKVAEMLLWLDE